MALCWMSLASGMLLCFDLTTCLGCVQAQRFLALVLLPKVRQDIEDNKRCHFALFQAMKKATYKPDAFFKVPLPASPLFMKSALTLFSVSIQACLGKLVAWSSIGLLAPWLLDVWNGGDRLWPAWLLYAVNAVVSQPCPICLRQSVIFQPLCCDSKVCP